MSLDFFGRFLKLCNDLIHMFSFGLGEEEIEISPCRAARSHKDNGPIGIQVLLQNTRERGSG